MRKWKRRGVESVRLQGRASCIPTFRIPPELVYSQLSAIQWPPTHIKIQSPTGLIDLFWPHLLILSCLLPTCTLSFSLLLELSKHVPLSGTELLLFPLLGKLYPQSLLRFILSICSHLPSNVTLEPLGTCSWGFAQILTFQPKHWDGNCWCSDSKFCQQIITK